MLRAPARPLMTIKPNTAPTLMAASPKRANTPLGPAALLMTPATKGNSACDPYMAALISPMALPASCPPYSTDAALRLGVQRLTLMAVITNESDSVANVPEKEIGRASCGERVCKYV